MRTSVRALPVRGEMISVVVGVSWSGGGDGSSDAVTRALPVPAFPLILDV
jgi:hypothetical protein